MSVINLMNKILEEKQIYAVYQPICNLDNEKVYGYEGLTRTNNPDVSSVIELIEMAEKVNKIQELDLLMMEQVIRCFHGSGKLFINMVGKPAIAVKEYLEKMILTAKEARISLDNIVIELSERASWNQESLDVVRTFKAQYNFLLAIDDFGVGFSNSLLLLDAQPDIVKIDRIFIEKIYQDRRKHAFVRAFIEIIKGSNMEIICEGIEEEEELKVLKSLGSDYGQGYFLGKPETQFFKYGDEKKR